MWMTIKASEGDTVETLAKKYKLKKADLIWTFGDNKKLRKPYDKNKSFPKGTVISLPDPMAKVAVVTHNGKKIMLSEAEHKKLAADGKKAMIAAAKELEAAYKKTAHRHDLQLTANENHTFASFVSGGYFNLPALTDARTGA